MGLKIITQIGTDQGITNEAYIRIVNYEITKSGHANFRTELFQKQSDCKPTNTTEISMCAINKEIGNSLNTSLLKEVVETVKVKRLIPIQVEKIVKVPGPLDKDGNTTLIDQKTMVTESQEKEVEEAITTMTPDFTPLDEISIFEFGYVKLREKLSGLFGAKNIIDC